jgi:hypothetical protein
MILALLPLLGLIAVPAVMISSVVYAQQAPLTQTVRFEVPVKLADIYSTIKSFSVQCRLGPYFLREDVQFVRNYSGVVELTSKPIANEVANQIKEWSCKLYFFPEAGQGEVPSFAAQNEMFKAKAGTKLVTEVKGTIGAPAPLMLQPAMPQPMMPGLR